MNATPNPDARPAMLLMIDGLEAVTPGGTERQVLAFAEILHHAGYRVVIYVLRGNPLHAHGEHSFEVHYANIPSITRPAGLAALWRLVGWMKRNRFVAVQTFLLESNLVGPFLARRAGVPVIIGHRRNTNHWMSRSFGRMQSVSNRFATRLLANSERVRQFVVEQESTTSSKVDVLYNGVDVDRFAPDAAQRSKVRAEFGISPADILIGCVATLRPVKGLADLITAAQQVTAADPRAKFIIAGDGPLRPELEKQIAAAGLEGRFLLAGAREDIPAFLQALDIAVNPSLAEGFSNAILEFMAAGLPIVATDVGGNKEALGADAGILVSPGDPQELSALLIGLLKDEAGRKKLGHAARKRAAVEFNASRAQALYLQYLSGLISTPEA